MTPGRQINPFNWIFFVALSCVFARRSLFQAQRVSTGCFSSSAFRHSRSFHLFDAIRASSQMTAWKIAENGKEAREIVVCVWVGAERVEKHDEHPWRCWGETNESVEGKGRVIFITTMVMSLTAVRGRIKFYVLSKKFHPQANSA